MSPLSLRKDAVNSFGNSVSETFGNVGEFKVEKISSFESPEKWIVKNDDWGEYARATQNHMTAIAIRVLLDAFLYFVWDTERLNGPIFLLKNMRIKPLYHQALEKGFEFVCGEPIEKVDPQSNRLITRTGFQVDELSS